jgi:hypothetical protein
MSGSTFLSDKNVMFFGGKSGITYFVPENIVKDSVPPEIVLTKMFVFNKEVGICPDSVHKDNKGVCLSKSIQYLDYIKIKDKINLIGFEFAALNFINSDKNQYKYKLEGFDRIGKM